MIICVIYDLCDSLCGVSCDNDRANPPDTPQCCGDLCVKFRANLPDRLHFVTIFVIMFVMMFVVFGRANPPEWLHFVEM